MRLKLVTVALGVAFLLLSGFRPGALPYTPGAPFSDAATSHWPASLYLRRSVLEDGAFPLWRETIMAGQPFAADPLNKTAYPLQWLALLLPPELHLDLMIVLHLLIAGAGMWVWARSLGLREEAAAFSALAYALAPRVIGHTGAGHLDLLYALAWFPWWMWSVRQVIHEDDRGARRVVFRQSTLLGALFGALILLADVRLSLFAYALAGSSALYEALRLKRARRLWRFVPAALLVALLTLSLTVPLLGWRPYLSRAALTPEESGVFSLTPAQLIGLILPARGGNIETLTYLGWPVLALALIGGVATRRWFWVAAMGAAALFALGINGFLWPLLIRVVPALLWFRVPSRAWFVIVLLAPLLAGYGVQWLLDQRASLAARPALAAHPSRGTLITLIGMAALLAGGIFLTLLVPAVNGMAVIIGGGGYSLIMLLALNGRLSGERLALALIAVTFLDLALVGCGWLEWRTQDAWMPPDQVHLAERLAELGAYRVYSPTYSLQQQVAEDYHLRLFGGVDPFQLNGIVAAVEQGGGIAGQGYSVVLPPLSGADAATANHGAVPNTALLGRWGVTHVVSAYPLDVPMLEQVDVIDGVYVYANRDPALTTAFGALPAWPQQASDLPDRRTVETLNQETLTAALVSGAALIGLLALLGVVKVRH